MPHSTKLSNEDKAACRELAKLLRQRKDLDGMTHKDLGKLIGMSDKSVSAMVNGRMRISINTGRRLSRIFNVPLTQILPWTAEIAEESYKLINVIELYRQLDDPSQDIAEQMIQMLLAKQLNSPDKPK